MQLPSRDPDRQPLFESSLYDSGEARLLRTFLWDSLLRRFDDKPGLTQTDAARRSGISRPSVKNYMRAMTREILGTDGLGLNPDAGYALGVDFARTHAVRVVLTNIHGKVATDLAGNPALIPNDGPETGDGGEGDHHRHELALSPRETIAVAVDRIDEILERTGVSPAAIVGIGIGLPTPSAGLSPTDAAIGHWRRHSPKKMLLTALAKRRPAEENLWQSLPVRVDNDTNMSAVANHLWGNDQSDNTLFVKWMAGLRASLIMNGTLVYGADGAAGELQHVPVDGVTKTCGVPKCPVGEGCIFAAAPIEPLRTFAQEVCGDPDILWAHEIVGRAATHEALATRLDDIGEALGEMLAPLARLTNPDLIVVGGALGARVYPIVLDRFGDAFERNANLELDAGSEEWGSRGEGDITVTNSLQKNRATVTGAAAMALLEFGTGYLLGRVNDVRQLRRAG